MRIASYFAAGIVIVHGLIHLMGFVAYWPLGEIAELPYKTTLLGGRWELGEAGTRLFSTLWLAGTIVLVGGVVGAVLQRDWWLPVLISAVLLSLLVCLLDWGNAWRGVLVNLVILIPLLLLFGLRLQPRPLAPFSQGAGALTAVELPADLPAPVARYYQAITGDVVPVVETAVVTGRGTLRFAGVTFPARLRFTYKAGQGYRHYIEATMFGYPLLKVNEWYLDGHTRLELPVGVVEHEPKIDQAANLGLWGESIWFPPIFLTDQRVSWQPIDDTTARLIVPLADDQDSFTVDFDPETGLIKRMTALRYRDAGDEEKIPWQLDVLAWDEYHGILVPSHSSVTWADEQSPWLVIELDDITYNVEVRDYIRAEGP